MKSPAHIVGSFKGHLASMVYKSTAIAVFDCGQAFAEGVSFGEPQRQDEPSAFVNVSPFAWVLNPSDARVSFLPDVNGGQAFGKVAHDVELRSDDDLTGGVDKNRFAIHRHAGYPFVEVPCSIKLSWD